MKIRTRFLISFLVVALVPLVAASALFVVVARNTVRDQAIRELEAVAEIQKHRVEYMMAQGHVRLAQVESRTLLRQALSEYDANPNAESLARVNLSLADAVASLPGFKSMSVLDGNGTVIASSVPSEIGKDQSGSAAFKKGQTKNDMSVFAKGADGELEQYLTGPIVVDGKPLGVLSIKASADDLSHLMTDYTGLGKTGETVIAENAPDGGARFLGPTRFGTKVPLSTVVEGTRENVPINIALDKRAETLTDSVDYRGKPVLAVTEHVDDPPLGLVVKIDKAEAFAPINGMIAVVVVTLGAVVLVVILVSILLASSVTRPITALTSVAEAVGEGDLTRRADTDRKDEVGTLARAFNQMSDELAAERAQLEHKVEERTAELARSNMELDGYAHTVSHDLRGPVSSINLAASIMAETLEKPVDEADREEMIGLVKEIQSGTSRSFSLINDLLTLAEAGHEPSAVDRIDLNETVNRIIVERADRIKNKNARVIVDGDLGDVHANPTQVYLLFNNLIVNAIKHNDSPAPLVEVRKLGETEDGGKRFEVRDNGPGITAEDFPRIFEPFFKGKGGETGIGLATVQKIVEAYGGEISACNEESSGACFEFVLHDYPPENRS